MVRGTTVRRRPPTLLPGTIDMPADGVATFGGAASFTALVRHRQTSSTCCAHAISDVDNFDIEAASTRAYRSHTPRRLSGADRPNSQNADAAPRGFGESCRCDARLDSDHDPRRELVLITGRDLYARGHARLVSLMRERASGDLLDLTARLSATLAEPPCLFDTTMREEHRLPATVFRLAPPVGAARRYHRPGTRRSRHRRAEPRLSRAASAASPPACCRSRAPPAARHRPLLISPVVIVPRPVGTPARLRRVASPMKAPPQVATPPRNSLVALICRRGLGGSALLVRRGLVNAAAATSARHREVIDRPSTAVPRAKSRSAEERAVRRPRPPRSASRAADRSCGCAPAPTGSLERGLVFRRAIR